VWEQRTELNTTVCRMSLSAHNVLEFWTHEVPLTLFIILAAFLYFRGWLRVHSAGLGTFAAWRAGSFCLGLMLIWIAIGSRLASLDHQLLTAHMIQHLLLMTLAPALILLGEPMQVLWYGVPKFGRVALRLVFQKPIVRRLATVLIKPGLCWTVSAVTLIGWHLPMVFTMGMHSEVWHAAEQSSFLGAGFLFWWPVIRPWPSTVSPRWSTIIYLFLATLPCDILSGFLVFCDRVVYTEHLSTLKEFGVYALEDQQRAGALMWTCVTVVYLVAAAIVAVRLLSVRSGEENEPSQPEMAATVAAGAGPQSVEVG